MVQRAAAAKVAAAQASVVASAGLRDAADIASSAAEQATKAVAKVGDEGGVWLDEAEYSGWYGLFCI